MNEEIREDIKVMFEEAPRSELLQKLSEIADAVDYAEDVDVILDIQKMLGQKPH